MLADDVVVVESIVVLHSRVYDDICQTLSDRFVQAMFPFTQRVSENQLSISPVDGVVQFFQFFFAYDF